MFIVNKLRSTRQGKGRKATAMRKGPNNVCEFSFFPHTPINILLHISYKSSLHLDIIKKQVQPEKIGSVRVGSLAQSFVS